MSSEAMTLRKSMSDMFDLSTQADNMSKEDISVAVQHNITPVLDLFDEVLKDPDTDFSAMQDTIKSLMQNLTVMLDTIEFDEAFDTRVRDMRTKLLAHLV